MSYICTDDYRWFCTDYSQVVASFTNLEKYSSIFFSMLWLRSKVIVALEWLRRAFLVSNASESTYKIAPQKQIIFCLTLDQQISNRPNNNIWCIVVNIITEYHESCFRMLYTKYVQRQQSIVTFSAVLRFITTDTRVTYNHANHSKMLTFCGYKSYQDGHNLNIKLSLKSAVMAHWQLPKNTVSACPYTLPWFEVGCHKSKSATD